MTDTLPQIADALAPWLEGRSLADWRAQFDRDGFIVFGKVLTDDEIAAIRGALQPHLDRDQPGRNAFEGRKTNRVYGLLAKSPVFADLCIHPLAMAFVEADLEASALLSACLAINLHPGETAQPWHYDEAHIRLPRPRPSAKVSAFWAIDATTHENGATEVLPGSHLWGDDAFAGMLAEEHFAGASPADDDPGARADAVQAPLPAGGLMLAKGTLWHRGGANRSNASRLIVTPQYCAGWARPLETMTLSVPPEKAATLPERAQELLGYSIHPPFMGYVDGVHPKKTLPRG